MRLRESQCKSLGKEQTECVSGSFRKHLRGAGVERPEERVAADEVSQVSKEGI